MIVEQASAAHITYVVQNMREEDLREVMAGRFVDDLDALAYDLIESKPWCFALLALSADDGPPIAIIGGRFRWPGVGSIIMIATDDWPQIASVATRWVKRVAIPKILDPLCHRTQCEAWEGNTVTLRWLTALGYRVEGKLEAYGKNREGFLQYARIRQSDE